MDQIFVECKGRNPGNFNNGLSDYFREVEELATKI